MGTTHHSIQIDALIKPRLEDMSKIVADLQKSLANGATKIDMTKGIGKDLSKLFSAFETGYSKINALTPNNLLNIGDAKDFQKNSEAIIHAFREIQRLTSDMGTKSILDAKKLFPEAFDSRISELYNSLQNLSNKLEEVEKKKSQLSRLEGEISKLQTKQDLAKNEEKIRISTEEADKKLAATKTKVQDVISSVANELVVNIKVEDKGKIEQAKKDLEEMAELEGKGIQKKGRYSTFQGKNLTTWKKELKNAKTEDQVKNAEAAIGMITRYNELLRQAQEGWSKIASIMKIMEQDPGLNDPKNQAQVAKILSGNEEVTNALQAQQQAAREAAQAHKELGEAQKAQTDSPKTDAALAQKIEQAKQLRQSIQTLESATNIDQIFAGLTKVDGLQNLNAELLKTPQGIQQIKTALTDIDTNAYDALVAKLKELAISSPEAAQTLEMFGERARGAGEDVNDFMSRTRQLEQLKYRLSYFFGIANVMQLFKRTVQSALNTVKELDAVMTETAVVTDFTVGDMWEKLPEYAKQASALGSSIKDLYSATTLYYQQGLDSEAAMGVGIETMKMARIAGMEASDATTAMTAALRGFNMEVNEMNAQRVNDVYSELAAITAADTNQIATAMGKTASIAASANMEFETTSALLAQIIETTQEAPETAGTAMKTIIARFTEVKELFSEGMLSGEDEEGEEININKIDAALKSVGISLKDFLKGSKGIDDIFIELASKWDTLDLATQRYIATTAAGSRQQSRFIAMMSNYERTMELVTAANNSAGASQEQFDKTLESMDTKIQNMKNAWNEFIMGLANQEVLKGGITILTTIIEVINKVLTFFSGGEGGNSGIKSILTLVTFISALKGGATLVKKLFSSEFTKIFTSVETKSKTTGIKVGSNLLSGVQKTVPQIQNTISNGIAQGAVDGVQRANQALSGLAIPGLKNGNINSHKGKKLHLNRTYGGKLHLNRPQGANTNPQKPETEIIPAPQTENLTKWQKFTRSTEAGAIGATGAIAMLSGVLVNYGAQALETAGKSGPLSKALEAVGTTATFAGSAVTMLAPTLSKLKIPAGKIGLIILAITAIIGVLTLAAQAAKEASPEGQLKKAQEATQKAGDAAEQAAASYDKLASSLDSVAEKSKNLEGLAKGTAEYKSALADLNQEMLDLIAMYPELNEYVEPRNGQLVFKEGSESNVQAVKNDYAEAKISSQSALAAAQINEIEKAKNVEYDDLNMKIRREVNDQGQTFEQWRQSAQGKEDIEITRRAYPNITDQEIFNQMFVGGLTFTDLQKETEQLAKDLYLNKIDKEEVINELGIELYTEETKAKAINELRGFGQALVEGESKAKLYQESILNNAKVNVKATEEQKNAMQNFLSQADISDLVEGQKQAILKDYEATDINQLSKEEMAELREQYAGAMNYLMEGGKMYTYQDGEKIEVERTDEEIVQGLAGIKTQDNITEDMKKFSQVLPSLQKDANGLGAVFAKITSKGEGAALTFADLEKLRDYEAQMIKDTETGAITFTTGSVMETLYNQVSDIWTAEEFYNLIQEAVVPTESREDIINRKTETMGISEFFEGVDIETGAIQGVVESLFDVFTVSGSQAAKNLSQIFTTEFDKLDPEQAQLFAEGLNLIDWSNLEQVEGLDSVLTDLGFDVDSLTIPIEDLENMIKEAAKSAKKFNLDTLKEEIKAADDLIEDLKDREDTERKFTKEEKERIIKADEGLEGQFVATGIDEFVYIGDSIDSLVAALNNNTAALLGEYGEQVKYNADMSRSWETLKETEAWTHNGEAGEDSRGYNSYDVLAAIATADSVSSGAELIGTDFASEAVQNLMIQLGMGAADAIGKMSASEMSELIRQNYDLYGSYAARQGNYDAETNYLENEEQIRLSQMSGQDVLLDAEGTQEDKNKALDAQMATEGLFDEYEKTYEGLSKVNAEFKEHESLIKAAVTDSNQYEKNLSKLSDTYKENKNALSKNNKGTREYQKALTNITKAAQKAFGNDITEEFVEENLDLFEDFSEGTEESADALRSAILNSLKDVGKYTNSEFSAIEGAAQGLDGLNFDIYGHADASQIFSELAAVLGSAEEAAAAMEALGYSVTWVPDGVTEMLMPDNTTKAIPNYKTVVTDSAGNTESANRSSGGGGGGGDKKKWENPYDEFYNTVEDINEELRTREKLERRYQALLDKTGTKASDLVKNAQQQIASLEKERKMREGLLQGRNRQMTDIENEYSDLSKYAWYNEQDGTIEIDWNKIEGLDGSTNEELTSRIEEYIGKLEDQQDLIEEEEDAIAEIEEAVKEIRDQGKDEYFDLEGQIRDAIQSSYQKEIDSLSAINESINDTNSNLIDAIQQSIEKQRQERENEKTEQELADKQSRLTYLQQDTSGANALDILKLQEEIEQGREDYTDTLIDQKISELQKQNDEAAQQRERQIEIAQEQLDFYIETGEVWKQVYDLMDTGIDSDGIKISSSLWSLLQSESDYASMSNLEKLKWAEELNDNVAQAMQWIKVGNQLEYLDMKGKKIDFTTVDGTKLSGTIDKDGNITADGKTYKNIYRNYDGTYVTDEEYEKIEPKKEPVQTTTPVSTPTTTTNKNNGSGGSTKTGPYTKYEQRPDGMYKITYYMQNGKEVDKKYSLVQTASSSASKVRVATWTQTSSDGKYIETWEQYADGSKKIVSKKLIVSNTSRGGGGQKAATGRITYATGGLADFTGPAWLDGTKSRPEYVLNSDQTRAFFTLVDVLESLHVGASKTTENSGDTNYDIDINVESIGSDYDVEQMASTIKRLINDDARYRNNNAVNLMR